MEDEVRVKRGSKGVEERSGGGGEDEEGKQRSGRGGEGEKGRGEVKEARRRQDTTSSNSTARAVRSPQ